MLRTIVTNFFQTRDELSIGNIRLGLWPVLLIFPLSVIMGDLRYFDLKFAVANFESWELMLFPLGLGWLAAALLPRRLVIPCLRIAALACAVLLPLQIFSADMSRFVFFMAFQFFNGVCAACAFSLFCFELNNVERLTGMLLIQLYYGFYYTVWRAVPAVAAAGKTWGSAIAMAIYLIVVLACTTRTIKYENLESTEETDKREPRTIDATLTSGRSAEKSAVFFIIGLDFVYYIIMCMINYIEWADSSVDPLTFGIGSAIAIAVILFVQLLNNRNALHIWLLFLALSLLGLGILLFESPTARYAGSFAYGLGDGLGYIIIYYICAGVLKRSNSFKMYRFYCVMFFVEYCIVSGIFSVLFKYVDAPNGVIAFAIVLVLGCICISLIPLMQRKLFEADWSDGVHLNEIAEYALPFEETEALNKKDHLLLTDREEEIFTLLLAGKAPKEIAYTLKISYNTVGFHQKHLYRKLGVQSRAELFARYQPVQHSS